MDYEVSTRIADDHSNTQRPNIVLIMTDQQTYNTLGCYGNSTIKTPNIDRLAAEGVLFERAYTTCPLCAPARASFFTGLPVSRTGSPVLPEATGMHGRRRIGPKWSRLPRK